MEDLRQHAHWMRALARALVQDTATAEDLVQDTCVRALAHRPAQVGSLRAWLRRVLLNRASQHHRSEARRSQREAASAPTPEVASPDVLSERLESQRILGEEFPHLSEPYRTMLWLRFYEDVAPIEIARRMGIPPGTARWRIKRGLELLRNRLDERHGGDRSTWCSLFFGWALHRAASPASTPTAPLLPLVLMNTTTKVAVGLAVVVISVVAFSELRGAELFGEGAAVGVFEPIVAPATPTTAPAAGLSDQFQQLEQRVAVDPLDAPPPVALDAAPRARLLARFVDRSGNGIRGVTLREIVSGQFGTRTGQHVKSAEDGSAQLAFPEGRPEGPVLLDATALGFIRHEIALDLYAGRHTDLGVIVLRPGGAISGRVVDAEGRGISGVSVRTGDPKMSRRRLEARRIRNGAGSFPDTTSEGGGEFVLKGLKPGRVRLWAQVDQGLASYSRPIEVRAGQVSTGVTLVLEDPREEHVVRGIVLHPDGTPVPDAQLKYCFSAEEGSMSTQTKWALADGTFELFLIDDLKWWIRAFDPEERFPPAETAHFEDPPTGELVISFSEGHSLEIRAEDRTGRPIEVFGFRIVSPQPKHTGLDARYTHQEEPRRKRAAGRARFLVPSEEFLVEVDATGFELGSIGPLRPAEVAGELHVTLDVLPVLSGRVLSAGGPVGGASVSLRQVTQVNFIVNGFRSLVEFDSTERVTSDDTGTFVLTPRGTGEFVVRVEAAGYAPAVWGPVQIEREVGRTDVEIVVGQGGSIAGRLILTGGDHPASRAIGASRGDGTPLFAQTDADGAYRFDGLTPGPWEVRYLEAPSGPDSTHFEYSRADPIGGGIEWSCEVHEGRITYFDIYPETEPPPAACKLVGWMLFDSEGEWVVALGPPAEHFLDDGDPVQVTAEGRFEMSAERPGSYRLQMTNEASFQYITDLVELVKGTSSWSMDQRQGPLEIVGLEPGASSDDFPPLVHLWRGPGELLVITALFPDENGACAVEAVPAGIGELLIPDPENLDPSTWEAVRKVTVRSNRATVVRIE